MDSDRSYLSDLKAERDSCNCNVVVRVIRKWEEIDRNKGKLLNVADKQESLMQLMIRRDQAPKVKRLIHEGEIYLIKNVGVEKSSGLYLPLDLQFRLTFKSRTKITKLCPSIVSIPRWKFAFVSTDVLRTRIGDATFLSDVIVVLRRIHAVETVETDKKSIPKRSLEVEDERTVMEVTLWDGKISEIDSAMIREDKKNVVIIVIQWKMNLNSCSGTCVYVNLDIVEVGEFKERIKGKVIHVEELEFRKMQLIGSEAPDG